MSYIDSHTHLTSERFDSDRNEVIERAFADGLSTILDVGDTLTSSKAAQVLAQEYEKIYTAAGIHPHNTKETPDDYIDQLKTLLKNDKTIALGEIGLDYYYDFSPKDIQKQLFREQIKCAKELNLPVIIHARDAYDDIFSILDDEKADTLRGVFHCFSSTAANAERIIKNGFYISFSGILTFKKAHELRQIIATIPENRILAETDCPYLAPQAYRGKRNEPAYVTEVYKAIAEVQEKPLDEIQHRISENFSCLFLQNIR